LSLGDEPVLALNVSSKLTALTMVILIATYSYRKSTKTIGGL
jgi:hypothetical protein